MAHHHVHQRHLLSSPHLKQTVAVTNIVNHYENGVQEVHIPNNKCGWSSLDKAQFPKYSCPHHFDNFLSKLFILLLITSSYFCTGVSGDRDSSFKGILSLLQTGYPQNDSGHRIKVQRQVTSQVEVLLWQVDKLRQLGYGQPCDSMASEKARHELTELVANVTQNPSEQLFKEIDSKHESIIKSGKLMCDYSRGLTCDSGSLKCICYNGQRHDINYETVREAGACKLDEMSRCYSPSYLVSRGAVIIHCINGAKCVGDLSGQRCFSPIMNENCHCQKPCPDGSFTNLMDELRKCIAKLSEISNLQFGDNCTAQDQTERDDVVEVLETSGSERAGPIIRGIKKLLASNRTLCSPQDQLICHPEEQKCVCGPEKDGIIYERENGSCLWAKGSRCFPEDIYANVTGSNGSCVTGTECFMEGEAIVCDPNYEEPQCYCQDPQELESSGVVVILLILLMVLLGAGCIMGFLVHAKIISLPGSSPANV